MPWDTAFVFATASGCLIAGILVISAGSPKHRIWPPLRGSHDWRFFLVWGLLGVFAVSGIWLGLENHGTLGLPHLTAFLVGAVVCLAGNLLAWWGAWRIGSAATVGLEDELVVSGPYRYSRNPQYLGDVLVLAGAVLLFNSVALILPAVLGIVAAIAAPFAEEPWLQERYGKRYEEYCRHVHRYL